MSLILRQSNLPNTGPDYIKGTPLTYDQLDGNFAAISASLALRPFNAGPGIIISGQDISASVVSVNGVFPVNGNVAISITSTLTGPLGNRPFAAADATVYVVSQDPVTSNNGDAYIYVAASSTWEPIAPLDVVQADARYLKLDASNDPMQATLDMGNYDIINVGTMFGTATTASFITGSGVYGPHGANSVISASWAEFVTGSIFTGSNAAVSSSYAVTASYAMNAPQVDTSKILSGSTIVQTYNSGLVEITGSSDNTTRLVLSGSLIVGRNSATGLNGVVFGTGSVVSGNYSLAQGDGSAATGNYSHAEGHLTNAQASYTHAEGESTYAGQDGSHAEGYFTSASAQWSHAEGYTTKTEGFYSHAEGEYTYAAGQSSHAEGNFTSASGNHSHAEGSQTYAGGLGSHAEGNGYNFSGTSIITTNVTYVEYGTAASLEFGDNITTLSTTQMTVAGDYTALTSPFTASYFYILDGANDFIVNTNYYNSPIINSIAFDGTYTTFSFSPSIEPVYYDIDGFGNKAVGDYSHAEGFGNLATGDYSHAEGYKAIASGSYSHAEGSYTVASGTGAHAEGFSTVASGDLSHAEGAATVAAGPTSHAEGSYTIASGYWSHAEGQYTIASGTISHAEGALTLASGTGAHAEGFYTTASGDYSHTQGRYTLTTDAYAHAEGQYTIAANASSHAEGNYTVASGSYSHAEGDNTLTIGYGSHAEGYLTTASGNWSHVEGSGSITLGEGSHAQGVATIASGSYQAVIGRYNQQDDTTSLFIIGNGTSNTNRSDVVKVSGSQVQITGSLIVSSSSTVIGTHTVTGSLIVSSSATIIGREVVSGSLVVTGSGAITGSLIVSGSGNNQVTIAGSGSSNPLFRVYGTQGELFTVTDSMSGSLFSVNDISGLPIVDVRSDQTTLIGNYLAPGMYASTKVVANTGVTVVYSVPTSSYDGAWFDYTIKSGSVGRVGSIMAVWSGSSVNYTETTASSFGTTTGFTFGVNISGSNMILSGSAPTNTWIVKTIVRAI